MGQTGSRNGAGSLREELGKVGQRRDGKVACDTDHAPAKDLQPHGVLVLADNGLLVAAEQHTAQEIGRIRPLRAPARMTMRFAPPRIAITSVEKAMKPTMNHLSFLAMKG